MKPLALTQALVVLVLALAGPLALGCGGKGSLPPLEPYGGGDYRLDSGDRLRIIVFGQDDELL